MKFLSRNTRDSRLSLGENQSLYLTWAAIGTGRDVTPGETDRPTELPYS